MVVALSAACSSTPAYVCSTDAQCVRSGEAGLCIEPGWCAFPDGECDTGYRFAAQAEPGLENECLPFEPGDSSTGSSSTSADTGKVDTLSTTGTDASTTEVDPTTQTTVPITTGPDSESATSTSGGPVTDGTMSGSSATVDSSAWLAVNGLLGGNVSVNPGGTLGGNGTIGGTVTNNGGTLAAGNSIGTTNYGSLIQNSGVVEVEIAPGGTTPGVHNDLYQVAGTAQINGGQVSVLAAPGAYTPGASYTFLTAGGGVSGAFDGIFDDMPFFDAQLFYERSEERRGGKECWDRGGGGE